MKLYTINDVYVNFLKLDSGKYGAINLNNMIPVFPKNVTEIDIANETDVQYKSLLQNQVATITAIERNICKKAQTLYNMVTTPDTELTSHDIVVKQRCCNFRLLETKMIEFHKAYQ